MIRNIIKVSVALVLVVAIIYAVRLFNLTTPDAVLARGYDAYLGGRTEASLMMTRHFGFRAAAFDAMAEGNLDHAKDAQWDEVFIVQMQDAIAWGREMQTATPEVRFVMAEKLIAGNWDGPRTNMTLALGRLLSASAAEDKYAPAIYHLSRAALNDQARVEKDFFLETMIKVAGKGDYLEAQKDLAERYSTEGRGVTPDPLKAAYWQFRASLKALILVETDGAGVEPLPPGQAIRDARLEEALLNVEPAHQYLIKDWIKRNYIPEP
jgi:hypothetical protein